jgi:hypothetical protein
MTYDQLHRRLQKLEQPHHSITIVAVDLYGEDEPEPPYEPGSQVIQITLGTPSELGEAAGR